MQVDVQYSSCSNTATFLLITPHHEERARYPPLHLRCYRHGGADVHRHQQVRLHCLARCQYLA